MKEVVSRIECISSPAEKTSWFNQLEFLEKDGPPDIKIVWDVVQLQHKEYWYFGCGDLDNEYQTFCVNSKQAGICI